MRRLAPALLVAAGMWCAASTPAHAQEAGAYWKVTVYTVPPAFETAFAGGIEKAVEAANQAMLAPEWGWMVYQAGSDYWVVTRHESLMDLEDPEAWSRQFAGTAGEATLQEAMGMFAEVHGLTVNSHISQDLPDWSYQPDEMAAAQMSEEGPGGVMIYQSWLMPNVEEAYAENTMAIMALFKEMGYPYGIYANRVVVGEEGMVYYVMPYDDLANVYGENQISNWLEKTGMGDKWAALFEARREMQVKTASLPIGYRAELSYWEE